MSSRAPLQKPSAHKISALLLSWGVQFKPQRPDYGNSNSHFAIMLCLSDCMPVEVISENYLKMSGNGGCGVEHAAVTEV